MNAIVDVVQPLLALIDILDNTIVDVCVGLLSLLKRHESAI